MESRAAEAGQTREEKNCSLLFDYLKDILYGRDVQTLSVEELDEPYRRLGAGLQFLEEAVNQTGSVRAASVQGQLFVRQFKEYKFDFESFDLAGHTGGFGRLFPARFRPGRIFGCL